MSRDRCLWYWILEVVLILVLKDTHIKKKEKKQWLLEEMFESRFPRSGGREEG
jgi:hypothetical protein